MKIITILGARPQFIKAAPVSKAISLVNREISDSKKRIKEIIVHTGQHYDQNMSKVFFEEMELPEPDYFFNINQISHGAMTGRMLEKIEEVMIREKPEITVVYGDTNSTIAGALASVKLHVPVAHIEAGLRSHNRGMPEEINRVLTDHASEVLFCPTSKAVKNLQAEGIKKNIHLVGDVMYDSVLHFSSIARKKTTILSGLDIKKKEYALATIHREENTDNRQNLNSIFTGLEKISRDMIPVIIPLHPRTRKKLEHIQFTPEFLTMIEPVSYLDMLSLEENAKLILTDSGGIQKEAYWFKKPCITLREETEWIETVQDGWNRLVGSDSDRMVRAVEHIDQETKHSLHYGHGNAAEKIIKQIVKFVKTRKG